MTTNTSACESTRTYEERKQGSDNYCSFEGEELVSILSASMLMSVQTCKTAVPIELNSDSSSRKRPAPESFSPLPSPSRKRPRKLSPLKKVAGKGGRASKTLAGPKGYDCENESVKKDGSEPELE